MVDLSTAVGGVRLANPVMTASGTSGHGTELSAYFDLALLGAVVVKSLAPFRWSGNPAPRLAPLAAGSMLNSVGLQGPGVREWIATDLPALARSGARVVASIWGRSPADYRAAAAALAEAALSQPCLVAVEANISCPNVEDSSRMFAHSVEGVRAAVGSAVAGAAGGLPVWAKLSPNLTDIAAMAGEAAGAGAAAVTLVNTVMGMSIEPSTGRPAVAAGGGGLSGPAIHPVAVRAVFECRAAWPELPIIGVGGVDGGRSAAELIAAGADAVQVGTATLADPRAPLRVLEELQSWCDGHGVASVADLRGRAH